jgi:hypothetical protein
MYFKLSRVDFVAISIHHGLGPKKILNCERKVIVGRYVWNYNYNNSGDKFPNAFHIIRIIIIHLEMLIVIKLICA